ncbi:hypothetical protein ACLKA7_006485 [Drosophila subpalustris]
MQQVARGNIYQIQYNLLELLVCLLTQLFDKIFSGTSTVATIKEMHLDQVEQQRRPHAPQQQQQQQQQQVSKYAKVELLHQMLVAQQLQHLEQRRLMRLALERQRQQQQQQQQQQQRRPDFELSN